MPAATLVSNPVFLTLVTTEPGGEGNIVRISAERADAATAGGIQSFERLVRAERLTLAQSRVTGLTNTQLDDAPDLDVVLQDLLEFSAGADAWIVPHAADSKTALRAASSRAGFPGRLGPTIIGIDELWGVVRPVAQASSLRVSSTTKVSSTKEKQWVDGLHDRGTLPHLKLKGGTYFVTFRLEGTLPQTFFAECKAELDSELKRISLSDAERLRLEEHYAEKIESHFDLGLGECWLRKPEIAQVVADAMTFFNGQRYALHSWVVMPNHVHAVLTPFEGHSLTEILHSWKSFTARTANKLLQREGPFWQTESYDHLIRDEEDFRRVCDYTLLNPIKAGLSRSIEEWAFSSALITTTNPNFHDLKTRRLEACATLRETFAALITELLNLPLSLLAEMNWLLSKSEHPLKNLLKKAESVAVKEQFSENFGTGKLSLDKLFQDFSKIIDRLAPEDEGGPVVMPTFTGQPVTAEEVGALLGPAGPLSKALKGYEERPEQVQMAQRVAESLSSGKHLLAEAGTGIGKSLAYLIPAILFAKRAGRPVVIATNTKNLQSQLFHKDIPFLKAHLGIDFEASLLKGRPNYLCLRKFMYTLQEASHELDDDERAQMLPIMTWATQTQDGDISEMAAFAPEKNPELWDRLHTVGDDCLKRQCPYYKRCFVYKARGQTRGTDIVVLNHAMVFADLNLESGTLPAYSEIVFDEAHKLEDIATDHLATEITPKRIYKILNRLFRVAPGSAAGKGLLPTLLANIEQARGEFTEAVISSIREHVLDVIQNVQPANEGSDLFFSVVRQWTEAPPPDDEEQPVRPFVPRERGRGGVYLEADVAQTPSWSQPHSSGSLPFKRRKPANYGDERKRFSAATLRADEVENFTQGKQSAIAQLGRLRKALETLEEDFKEIRKRSVPRARELTTEISAQKNFVVELINDIEFIIKGDEPNYVYWSERWGKRGVRIVAAPLDVSALLHDQLYEKKRSIIFASATLSVRDAEAGDAAGLAPYRQGSYRQGSGVRGQGSRDNWPLTPGPSPLPSKPHPKSFEFLKNRMGLSLCDPAKLDELLLGSPFDYATQCRLLIPTFIPEPGAREKDFNALFTAMAGEMIVASGGRAMVLYTSYAALESSARLLRKMLATEAIEVIAQGEGESRESLLSRLQANGRTVLLGTASFWEGVDVRGEALSLLVIAKLPFAVFTDPIVQGRCELLEAAGKDPFLHFSVPQAILKLRQGFGRLIRSKSDRGVVILADKRVLTKRYGAAFLRALPAQAHTMTSQDAMVQSVRSFLE